MIRTPLRPLARILKAREDGEDPGLIERENRRKRRDADRDRKRLRAQGRLLVLGLCFFAAYATIGVRMGILANVEPAEPKVASAGQQIVTQRADITDRNGRILATNLVTRSLYAQPHLMVEPERAARELAALFPEEMDEERLRGWFTGERKFIWLRRQMSPEQMQAVHDIGEPGLLFGPREMRLYPNGPLAAHILGGSRFEKEDVNAAEVIGTAGVEKAFDEYLRDPSQGGAPLALSLDMTVQSAAREVLGGGMRLMNARGAAAVLMDVHSGEVISMLSLPDFDPNDRPRPLASGNDPSESPLFNRAVQGVYELGSVFKIFAVAQAMELGLVNPDTMIDTKGPLVWGRYRIRDFHDYGPSLSVKNVIVESSNIGTAHIAMDIGAERQEDFLASLGFTTPTQIEMVEAPTGKPLLPPKWSEISTMTISYGHGLSASPLHLAAAYSTIVNGGTRVHPTLVKQAGPQNGERVISEQTSRAAVDMLRAVVTEGTASFGDVVGYEVAGKTGSADKPKPTGGYYKDRVIATFASTFPASDPKYVLIVTLDEGEDTIGSMPRRTAGWTAVPVAAAMIERIAPLLGLRPAVEPSQEAALIPANL
ncbi:penicillin-binding protein 2 [Roseicyclus sp. F158]|uniref:Penicillin-binding protein 2 n=1 Tax=Tropicimonas omnivorans TaxID=3075590 RepID=A0ABU3DI32_9RHOB|nr:penicillin-binding protein 2 [Roseicyclus sp. F158]MDT0683359.1 penicillin-binding protein 2 [Roseicyclus sp. F158]